MLMSKTTIGVVVGNANSPYTIDMINGIKEAAKQADVNVVCFLGMHSSFFYNKYIEANTQEDFDYQSSCVVDYDRMCDIDAYIVSYGTMALFMTDRELADFQRKMVGYPVVYLEKNIEGPKARYLVSDNRTGIGMIMDHMIKFHGYKKIVYLSGPMGNSDAEERLIGYKEAMQQAGISVTEDMIEFGDFSDAVDENVNRLLDANPDAEAIVCANDTMAMATYRVLEERALLYKKACELGDTASMKRYKKHTVGGKTETGIAVTGYDNIADAGNVEPPLTSIVQNPYSQGFMAVNMLLSLIENPDATDSVTAIPKPVIRQSCGCKRERHLDFPALDERYRIHPEQYAMTAAQIYTNGILPVELNDTISDEIYGILYEIILRNIKNYLGLTDRKFSADEMLQDAKRFLNCPASKYISRMTFISAFNDFMMSLLRNAKEGDEKTVLVEAEARISDYVYSRLFSETRDELFTYRHRSWFLPIISRDMANSLDSLKEMYFRAITKLNILNLGDIYLFVSDETISHRKNERWECPKELKLVAFSENGEITAYEPEDAPIVSRNNVINNYIEKPSESFNASILNLYSGEYQYGIIVAKTNPDDLLALYCASIQISTALKYGEMARVQRRAQKELTEIIREVEDKNEILRSLSEYDQLTNCYNRRGFLEKGLSLIRENVGRQACIIFADLDHLKEINDKYGHSEGDFAIENIAKNMKLALPDSAILARLGGDEFVALFLLSESMDAETLVKNISNMSITFNAMSAKPFYVECSAGHSVFECKEDTSLEEVMALADDFLYEAKARRRKSIVKSVTVV